MIIMYYPNHAISSFVQHIEGNTSYGMCLIYVYIQTLTYVRMYVYVYMYLYVQAYTYKYIYTVFLHDTENFIRFV